MYNAISIFPTILHHFQIEDFNDIQDNLINYVKLENGKDPEGKTQSNRGGWQSRDYYHTFDNPLKSALAEALPQLTKIFNKEIEFTSLWINVNPKGSFNHKHQHPGSHMSGVLWIKASEGALVFDNPSTYTQWAEIHGYNKPWSGPHYFFPPKDGNIVIFPSSLYHKVEVNEGDSDRISASFNIRFNG